jgi:hypothetical protein
MSEDLGRGRQAPAPAAWSGRLPTPAGGPAWATPDSVRPEATQPSDWSGGWATPGPGQASPPTADGTTGWATPGQGQASPPTADGTTGWATPGQGQASPPTADGTTGWATPNQEQPTASDGTGWAAPTGPAARDAQPPRWGGGPSPRSAEASSAQGRTGRIPLRPLDVGDVLDSTFGTIRRNPRTMIGLAALLVTLQQLLAVAAEVGTGDIPSVFGAFSQSAPLQVAGGIGIVLSLVLTTVVGAVLTGMVVVVVSEDILGRRVRLRDVWDRVRPRLWALITGAAIAGALPFAGLIFLLLPGAGVPLALITLVVPGALLWGAWALTTPALVLERLGPIRALRRSWRLAFPAFWRVWGIRVLSVLLGWVMQSLLLIPFAALGALIANLLGAGGDVPLPLPALACLVLGSILGGMIAQPFLAGVLALLYVDRRMRAEGFDIVIQQQARAARRAGTGGAPATGSASTTTVAMTGSPP